MNKDTREIVKAIKAEFIDIYESNGEDTALVEYVFNKHIGGKVNG